MEKGKNNYWQLIRGICILAVILIHTLYLTNSNYINISNIIFRRLVNFAVALFIFMAGYFTKIDKTSLFYKKKIIRLLPSLVIWDLIYIIFAYITKNNSISFIILVKDFIFSFPGYHLYYLYVLFQLFIIAPILIKVWKSKFKYIPLFVSFLYNIIIFTFGFFFSKSIPLYQYWLFGWITYYYLGLIIKDIKLPKNKLLVFGVLFFLIISISEGILVFVRNNELYSLATSQLAVFNTFYSLFICLLTYNLSKIFSNKIEKNILVKFGNYSFGIYLSHILILNIVKKFFSLVSLNYYINIIVVFICTCVIVYFINMIYYKYIKKIIIHKK